VADIGAGHGLLVRRLLATGRSPHCIATERTRALLDRIRDFPASHRLAGTLELRSGDGLAALGPDDEVDVIVAAGLGGPTILGILKRSPLPCSAFGRFVFQPQTEHGRFRRGVIELGLTIVAERLVRERGRYYLVLAAETGTVPADPSWPGLATEDVLEAGPCLLRDGHPLATPYWREQVRRLERILLRVGRGSGLRKARDRLEQARRILTAFERVGRRAGPRASS
jgi:tRNA (adenine22-N1)-methyltransferase